jgi:hypothetical protein
VRRAQGALVLLGSKSVPLCVIPEGAGTVNPFDEDRPGVVCRSSVQAGIDQQQGKRR